MSKLSRRRIRYSVITPASTFNFLSTTSIPVIPRSVRFARANTDSAAPSKLVGLDPMISLILLTHTCEDSLQIDQRESSATSTRPPCVSGILPVRHPAQVRSTALSAPSNHSFCRSHTRPNGRIAPVRRPARRHFRFLERTGRGRRCGVLLRCESRIGCPRLSILGVPRRKRNVHHLQPRPASRCCP